MSAAPEAQEVVPCPLCGAQACETVLFAQDRLFARPGTYHIVACAQCSLRYLSPRPTLAALASHYPSDYFIYQPPEALPSFTRPMLRWFTSLRWLANLKRMERALGRLRADLRVVDVGCGMNDYLCHLKARRGIEGVGVDFKPEVAAYVRDTLGMEVHAGTLREVGFADASFDLVSMHEYLEHEPNPLEVLREARRITAPGGHVSIEVPSSDSLPARVFGARWSQIDAPRHLVHFTRDTLSALLARSGYELVYTETFQIPYVIGLSLLQLLGHRTLGRLTFTDRALAMLATTPFLLVAPFIDEFRFVIARAV